jgi:hypothetical protein
MGEHDLQTFSRLFCETGNVALLIQTSRRGNESDAALFYWQHGGAHPRDFGFGFPLDASQLAKGHPGWRYPDPLDDSQPQAAPPPPPPPPAPKPAAPQWTPPATFSPSHDRIRWSRLVPTAVLVAIGIGVLQMATNSKHTVAAAQASPSASSSMTTSPVGGNEPAPVSNQKGLGLSVISRPHQLEIRWDRGAAAITESNRGLMQITEAGTTQSVPFDQNQLRDGYVAYMPKTKDVSIRLDVIDKDGGTTTDSIQAVAIP